MSVKIRKFQEGGNNDGNSAQTGSQNAQSSWMSFFQTNGPAMSAMMGLLASLSGASSNVVNGLTNLGGHANTFLNQTQSWNSEDWGNLDNKEKATNIMNASGAALGAIADFMPERDSLSGLYGNLSKTTESMVDMVGLMPGMVGAIYNAANGLSDIAAGAFGDALTTSGNSKSDAIMDAIPVLGLLNAGLGNAIGNNKIDDLDYDAEAWGTVGGSYAGSLTAVKDAAENTGGRYGILAKLTGEFRKDEEQNRQARLQQELVSKIGDEAKAALEIASSTMLEAMLNERKRLQGTTLSLRILKGMKIPSKNDINKIKNLLNKDDDDDFVLNFKPDYSILYKDEDKTKLSKEVLDFYKDYDLSDVNVVMSESPRTEGNTIYISNDEDAIHELWHYLSKNSPNEMYKDFYYDLNDDKIANMGGDLLFVKRFNGDPSYFYNPSELEARIKAAKYKTKGLNYTKEFFKELRKTPEKYGYNMRDLLYMYNDENLEKIFNLKQGGKTQNKEEKFKTRSLEELIQYAKEQNPRFVLRMTEPLKLLDLGNGDHATHLMAWEYTDDGLAMAFPTVMEDVEGNLYNYKDKALTEALNRGDYLIMSPKEALIFTEGYKQGWPMFFQQTPSQKFAKGGTMNIIPEGELHARLHHMELEGITKKGIPVISEEEGGEIVQHAEIERNEIIFRLEVTKKLEELMEDGSEEAALEAGKLLADEILNNTEDRTGLLNEVE